MEQRSILADRVLRACAHTKRANRSAGRESPGGKSVVGALLAAATKYILKAVPRAERRRTDEVERQDKEYQLVMAAVNFALPRPKRYTGRQTDGWTFTYDTTRKGTRSVPMQWGRDCEKRKLRTIFS